MQTILTKQATAKTKPATCGACGGPAILYLHGTPFAGIVQCQNVDCGASEDHEHAETHREEIELNQRPSSKILDIVEVEICDGCGIIVESAN